MYLLILENQGGWENFLAELRMDAPQARDAPGGPRRRPGLRRWKIRAQRAWDTSKAGELALEYLSLSLDFPEGAPFFPAVLVLAATLMAASPFLDLACAGFLAPVLATLAGVFSLALPAALALEAAAIPPNMEACTVPGASLTPG